MVHPPRNVDAAPDANTRRSWALLSRPQLYNAMGTRANTAAVDEAGRPSFSRRNWGISHAARACARQLRWRLRGGCPVPMWPVRPAPLHSSRASAPAHRGRPYLGIWAGLSPGCPGAKHGGTSDFVFSSLVWDRAPLTAERAGAASQGQTLRSWLRRRGSEIRPPCPTAVGVKLPRMGFRWRALQ